MRTRTISASAAPAPRTLRFASEPDYEMPTDANGDNVYKVMVVATDGSSGRGVGHVSVTVENVGEDGEVMLSAAQPHLGTPITAILSDPDIPDGEVTVSWQWMRSRAEAAMFDPIPGATTNTYTPVRLEMGDAGYYPPGDGDVPGRDERPQRSRSK